MLARRPIRREVPHHTGVRHGLRWYDISQMAGKKPKKATRIKHRVSKLPPDAEIDPAGPRLLPLPPDQRRRHETHPQIDSFVDLADAAMKLWDKKK